MAIILAAIFLFMGAQSTAAQSVVAEDGPSQGCAIPHYNSFLKEGEEFMIPLGPKCKVLTCDQDPAQDALVLYNNIYDCPLPRCVNPVLKEGACCKSCPDGYNCQISGTERLLGETDMFQNATHNCFCPLSAEGRTAEELKTAVCVSTAIPTTIPTTTTTTTTPSTTTATTDSTSHDSKHAVSSSNMSTFVMDLLRHITSKLGIKLFRKNPRNGHTASENNKGDLKSGAIITQVGSTVIKSGNSVTKGGSTVMIGGSSVTKGGSRVTKSGNSVIQGGSNVMIGGSSVTKGGSNVMIGGSSVIKGGSSERVNKDGTSVIKSGHSFTRSANGILSSGLNLLFGGNRVRGGTGSHVVKSGSGSKSFPGWKMIWSWTHHG